MLSEHEFEALLERYEDEPAVCGELLGAESVREPAAFVRLAHTAIVGKPASPVVKYIAALAVSAGVLPLLLELYSRDRFAALAFAKKIREMEPRFDVTLAEHLLDPAAPQEDSVIVAVLDILDAISEGDSLVPAILKLLKHANPKIRSKAALFVGGRTQSLAWAANRSGAYDSRVRADILESLYGLNSDFVSEMFRSHSSDENNRVVGNAALGLYLLGDSSSTPLICGLAEHPDARFRNTGAWVMGRTGDPRFGPVLSELLNDSDELVRSQAGKALSEIKKCVRAAAARPQVSVTLRRLRLNGPFSNVVATVLDSGGQPVRGIMPTSFLVKTGTPLRFVRNFSVEEYDCRSSLNIAFVLCLPTANEAAVSDRFVQAVEHCAPLRRSKDRWAVLKLSEKLSHRLPPEVPDGAMLRYWQKWAEQQTAEISESGLSSRHQDRIRRGPRSDFGDARPAGHPARGRRTAGCSVHL